MGVNLILPASINPIGSDLTSLRLAFVLEILLVNYTPEKANNYSTPPIDLKTLR
jgi:hypothetical protein